MVYDEPDDDRSFATEGAAFTPCVSCNGTGEQDPRTIIPDEEWEETIEEVVAAMRAGVVARLIEQGRVLPKARFALAQLREFLTEKGF